MEMTDDRSITPLTELADLEDKGHRIVEFLAGDVEPAEPHAQTA